MNKAIEILILVILIGFPFMVKLNTKKTPAQQSQSHKLGIGYIKYSLFVLGILFLFFILDRSIYNKPDFIQLGKGDSY